MHGDKASDMEKDLSDKESQIAQLLELRAADPERYPIQRLLRKLSSSLG